MANGEREFSFTTRTAQLGEQQFRLGINEGDLSSQTNAVFQDGTLEPDYDPVPAPTDIHARYDATTLSKSGGDYVPEWPDSTGNGYNLTVGSSPIFQTSVINSNPAVRFDRSNYLDTSFSTISEPFSIFLVIRMRELASGYNYIFDGASKYTAGIDQGDNSNWELYQGGSGVPGGSADTTPVILSAFFASSTDKLRKNGTKVLSGDTGRKGLDGITLSTNGNQGNQSSVDIGEVIVYPQDKSSIQADVEQYLSNKWGIAL